MPLDRYPLPVGGGRSDLLAWQGRVSRGPIIASKTARECSHDRTPTKAQPASGLLLMGDPRRPAGASSGRISLVIAFGTAFVLLAWMGGAVFVVPPLIRSAYRAESWPFLNDLISGRATHPVEAYLAAWRSVAMRTAAFVLGFGAAAFVAARPEVHAFLRPALPERALPFGNWRRLGVYGLIATVVLGSLACIALDTEAWPLSQYPMYSDMRQEEFHQTRVFGVTEFGEVDLSAAQYWRPYGRVHLGLAVDRWQADADRLEAALSDALSLYESRRLLGRHDGPAVRGLRFYRLEWRLQPWVENVDRPDQKELILEFLRESR